MRSTPSPAQIDPPASPAPLGKGRAYFMGRSLNETMDMAALLIWVTVSTIPMPAVSVFNYMLAGFFLSGFGRDPRQLLPAAARSWPVFVLPILAIVSGLWAPSAADAIRRGVLLALTGVFAIYLGSRLSGRQIISGYFLVELIAGLLSMADPNVEGGVARGIFDQKNVLAIHMFFLYVTSLAILLDGKFPSALRIGALAGAPLAVILVILSQSATTLGFLGASSFAFLLHALVWTPASRVRHLRTALTLIIVILVSLALFAALGILQINVYEEVLNLLGKDSTLTGRTYLWDQARRLMAENPLTGVGANGFWRPETGQANSILTYFSFERYTGFSFHNSYLENGVQMGYPGMFATILLAAWGLLSALRNWIASQTIVNAFFLIVTVLIVIRSNTEVDLAGELGITNILLMISAVRRNPPATAQSAPASERRS
ncbi:MAG: O-antigen ligase family protein [Alphaproteobacteria bacterium]|nr:O-antigen ligase family protein [Alphaproteobacteria bacterium]